MAQRPNSEVWCDRVKYEVLEARTQILDAIEARGSEDHGFIFVTPARGNQNQVALNPDFISSIAPYRNAGV